MVLLLVAQREPQEIGTKQGPDGVCVYVFDTGPGFSGAAILLPSLVVGCEGGGGGGGGEI